MGKVNLNIGGGDGPYNIIIREIGETTGNRYTGPNPTNTLTNLDVNYIKDGTAHLYSTSVSNGVCSGDTEVFEMTCPCEVLPSFVASQDCSNPSDPKISVTASYNFVDDYVIIRIYNSSNVMIHDTLIVAGTYSFPVSNNASYRVTVSSGYPDLLNCKAADQIINVACTISCNLTLSVSNPTC